MSDGLTESPPSDLPAIVAAMRTQLEEVNAHVSNIKTRLTNHSDRIVTAENQANEAISQSLVLAQEVAKFAESVSRLANSTKRALDELGLKSRQNEQAISALRSKIRRGGIV